MTCSEAALGLFFFFIFRYHALSSCIWRSFMVYMRSFTHYIRGEYSKCRNALLVFDAALFDVNRVTLIEREHLSRPLCSFSTEANTPLFYLWWNCSFNSEGTEEITWPKFYFMVRIDSLHKPHAVLIYVVFTLKQYSYISIRV